MLLKVQPFQFEKFSAFLSKILIIIMMMMMKCSSYAFLVQSFPFISHQCLSIEIDLARCISNFLLNNHHQLPEGSLLLRFWFFTFLLIVFCLSLIDLPWSSSCFMQNVYGMKNNRTLKRPVPLLQRLAFCNELISN